MNASRRRTRGLAASRRTLIAAIDAELATKPAAPRAGELARLKGQLSPQVADKKLHRIVLPDLEVDPLADPEELEQQAAALRASEAELAGQINQLTTQADRLARQAELRKQHARAEQLASRDDDQPRRDVTSPTRGGGEAGAVNSDGLGNPTGPVTQGSGSNEDGGFGSSSSSTPGGELDESATRFVLSEVVDASTLDALDRAHRTGDPGQRASAAKRTRDAVAARLRQLRARRAQIEQRARDLRK